MTVRCFVSREELRDVYLSCTNCDLSRCSSRKCFGTGPSQAPLALVGEAPGAEEDRTGRVFHGPAGQRLDAFLRALLPGSPDPREEIPVLNAVLCRPTDGQRNLAPTEAQVEACNERLQWELALAHPKVICCLGGIALNAVYGLACQNKTTLSVGRMRGRPIQINLMGQKMQVIATWHPSYEMRCLRDNKTDVSYELMADLAKSMDLVGLRR